MLNKNSVLFRPDALPYHHIVLTALKNVRIRCYSGPHFPAFGLNSERYRVSLHIQSECGKMRTRRTPNTDTFHAVSISRFKYTMEQVPLSL